LLEVKIVDNLYKTARPTVKTQLKTGFDALEESAKALSNQKRKSPRLIHFGTHSFANPSNYVESRYAAATLHRAGLVMANANWKTCKGEQPINDMDDGILTAFEIAQLNLSNTELVVMSSCQSALGEIQGREGVFGLTRGFKLAGVEYILASLWKVNDQETAVFMQLFYTHYLSGKTPVEAFELTQKSMKEKQNIGSWAAWVLMR
jgi:CHAT domain-containing protein